MEDYHYRIIELTKHHLAGENTREDEKELEAWIESDPKHKAFFNMLCRGEENEKRRIAFAQMDEADALRRFDRQIGYRAKISVGKWISYAAVIMVPVLIALLVLWTEESDRIPQRKHLVLAPGKQQAMLVLASGQRVLLEVQDSSREVTRHEGVQVVNQAGKLVYKDSSDQVIAQYNELITPRGGEYKITLTDGTLVRLNADSRLKYPVTFDREKREVHLSGEAYFEVTKDSRRPFYVITDGVRIKVYGTEFNINTHHAGIVQTTLVEGKIGVTVNTTGKEVMLKPDQMLEYNSKTGGVQVRNVDTYTYTAWKSGEFVFDNDRLEDIMEQLSLWYDVNVFYSDKSVKNLRFTGDATRFSDITDILSIFEKTGSVRFVVHDKTITIYPKTE